MLMPSIIIPEMQKVEVPAKTYRDPLTGITYTRAGCGVEVSPTLARYDDGTFAGGKTQEQARELLAQEGCQLPNMSLLWHLAETEGRNSLFFKDTFGRNRERLYRWEHTDTVLVAPPGWEPARMDGEKYLRNVCEYQLGKGLVLIAEGQRIPEGKGRRIVEINPTTGIPSETRDSNAEHIGHWYFSPELSENIVLFGSYWFDDGRGRCLGVGASCGPSGASGYGGFRPVRGLFGEVEKAPKTD